MFKVELADYGIKLTVQGHISIDESNAWGEEYIKKLAEVVARKQSFGHFVDLRGFKPGGPENQETTKKIMKAFKDAGGERSAVVLDNVVAVMQIRRLAKESGINDWERYIDPETYPDFEKRAIAWIVDGVDPE